MGSLIHFDENWFKDEEIDGFMVKAMMKRCWAAQLEVLKRVDDLCEELGVRYFANWGTLLGAVRHGNFIPWDDDIDITMLRDDYQVFSEAVRSGRLPDGLLIKDDHIDDDYENMIVCVVNSMELSTDDERMKTFHGCPYIVGVDIDVLDDAAPTPEIEKERVWKFNTLLNAMCTFRNIEQGVMENKDGLLEKTRNGVEQCIGESLDVKRSFCRQIHEWIYKLRIEYNGTSRWVNYAAFRLLSQEYWVQYEKEIFDDLIRLPFGPITVPVPQQYNKVLISIYGENYMKPIANSAGHDYPFYRFQEEALKNYLIERRMSGKEFGIDTGY